VRRSAVGFRRNSCRSAAGQDGRQRGKQRNIRVGRAFQDHRPPAREQRDTILKQGTYSLRFDLGSWEGQHKFAEYENFTLESEDRNYTLHIQGYHGNAGDAFIEVHNNQPFSTKGRVHLKHDKSRATCAETYKGGWWYRDDWCYNTNLNGVYYVKGNYSSAQADGVTWVNWLGYWYSLKATEMKIRPASFMGKSTET